MKKCLLDASSAILLFKCGFFETLVQTYCVQMAAFVFNELSIDGYPGARQFKESRAAGALTIINGIGGEVAYQEQIGPGNLLDRGEYDTICCYLAGKGDFIITDDGDAARYCRNHGIPFINALMFVQLLYVCDRLRLDEYQQRFAALISKGRYSPEIVRVAAGSDIAALAAFVP